MKIVEGLLAIGAIAILIVITWFVDKYKDDDWEDEKTE